MLQLAAGVLKLGLLYRAVFSLAPSLPRLLIQQCFHLKHPPLREKLQPPILFGDTARQVGVS